MGESLMQSYLKYEKGCLITQTNWKTASDWIKNSNEAQKEFNKIKENKEFSHLFGKMSFEQMLKQAELDVIGISKDDVYMVEVAFHEQGLRYGKNDDEMKDIVCKKMLRAYLTWITYFNSYTCKVIFATPKTTKQPKSKINECFNKLNNFCNHKKIEFHYLTNANFKKEILLPTLKHLDKDSDTSELFLRSAKMLKICKVMGSKNDRKNS